MSEADDTWDRALDALGITNRCVQCGHSRQLHEGNYVVVCTGTLAVSLDEHRVALDECTCTGYEAPPAAPASTH